MSREVKYIEEEIKAKIKEYKKARDKCSLPYVISNSWHYYDDQIKGLKEALKIIKEV